MTDGPGKYDDACTQARMATGADAVLLVVFGGKRGPGFSAQSAIGPLGVKTLCETLERVAAQMRADMDAELRQIAAQVTREHFGDTP